MTLAPAYAPVPPERAPRIAAAVAPVAPAVGPAEPPAARIEVAAYAVADADPPHDDGGPAPRQVRPLPPHRHQPVLRLVSGPDGGAVVTQAATAAAALDELGDPAPRAALLTRALLEVLAGVRPVGQLAPWVSPEVLVGLTRMVSTRVAAHPAPAALRRVLVSEPLPGIAEVTAIVQRGVRAEALALRMDARGGRWVVTALQRA